MEIADDLPKLDGYYLECQFIKGIWLEEHGSWEEAERFYAALPEDPDFLDEFAMAADHSRGVALENLGRWEEAVEAMLLHRDQRKVEVAVGQHILRAGLLQAAMGKHEEALETWALLKDVPADLYEEQEYAREIREAIGMVANADATLALWKRTDAWWEESFVPFCAKLDQPGDERLGFVFTTLELEPLEPGNHHRVQGRGRRGDPGPNPALGQPGPLPSHAASQGLPGILQSPAREDAQAAEGMRGSASWDS